MKQVSFSLFPGQAKSFKSKVDSSVQSKILRNYILNDYKLPEDLSIINEGDKKGLKPEKFLFDEYTDARLNELVKIIRELGYTANRSSLFRHIIQQLIEKLEKQNDSSSKEREILHSSFYFEKGTKEVLEQFVPFRDRNAVIERFILEEFKPTHNKSFLLEKPVEPESMRISMAKEAFRKLDSHVEEINTKGISRTALMRDVILQLINKLSKTDAHMLIAEKRLQNALVEFENTFGKEILRERLEEYKTNE
jgi:hypothetical protein